MQKDYNKDKESLKKRASHVYISLALLILGLFSLSPLQAQQEQSSAGLRTAYFATAGDLKETLPNGIGINVYYDYPLSSLFGSLPSYFPDSLQAMLNYEILSNEEEDEESELTSKYSLQRAGLELGPVWSFLLTESQVLSVALLGGFAQETSSNEREFLAPVENSGIVFSSHLLLNYAYHYSDFVFGGGLYAVYGADEELPLVGVGLNLDFGYKF